MIQRLSSEPSTQHPQRGSDKVTVPRLSSLIPALALEA